MVDDVEPGLPSATPLHEPLPPPPPAYTPPGGHLRGLGQHRQQEEVDGEQEGGDEVVPSHQQHPHSLHTH